jgi:ADP-ribosylglycohydrolase
LCARAESTFQVDHKDKASRRLAFARRGLQATRAVGGFAAVNGASWEAQVACPLALFCFMSSPETFDNVGVVAGMGGASTLNAALAGALAGAMSGAAAVPAGLRDQVESSGKIMAMSEKLASLLATREEDESNGANNNGEPV